MKQNLSILALLLVLFIACEQPANKASATTAAPVVATAPVDSLLRHVVLFKFKDGTTAADIKKVEDTFRALPAQIPAIKSFEFGINNSPEGLNQGYTHCFFLSFASEKDRAVYLPHPAHKAFGAVLTPYLDKVCVLDYWAAK